MHNYTKMGQEKKIWESYIPDYVDLYYVDYQDSLDSSEDGKRAISRVIQRNSFYPLSETVFDWWNYPEEPYIQEMRNKMASDGIGFNNDWIEEICEVLRDKDKSDPITDLLSNTGDLEMYYDLCEWFGGSWRCTDSQNRDSIDKICRILNIPKNDAKRREIIEELYYNSADGGELRIYFKCPLESVVSGDKYETDKKDFSTIKFKGNFTVALHDSIQGGGWSEDIDLDCEFEFKRENLQYANYGDRYSYYDVYGVHIESDAPILNMETNDSAIPVKLSDANYLIKQEEEYESTFKSGKCTKGDMKMSRHRDVSYINNFPCGWKCPHCGTFWID